MVSDATRNAVWQSYLDVVQIVYYYSALADRYQWRYLVVRSALLISVIGTAASIFLSLLHPYSIAIAIVLVSITAILTVMDYGDFAKKGLIFHGVSVEASHLASQWELLWLSMDDSDACDRATRQRNAELRRLLAEAIERARRTGITTDHGLNRECRDNVYAIMADKYRYSGADA